LDIAAWLRGLGLERYADAFRDNEIDADVLPTLTAEDLKDLGIEVVGHRRKLLNAIAALAEAESAPEPAPRAEPERRQLTVMFCDLVGSTTLSAQLDPEDMREVIRGYQDACAGVITRFDGFVAKYMGDGVLAYFGYPRAHEDDAERAVRAGLALTEAVANLRAPERLAARIGIATGLVVVGDLVGDGAAQEQAVVGDTPNLAARLQEVAESGQVVIGSTTRRLVGERFDLTDLGPQALKGLPESARAFVALGERALESRFEAHGGQVLPMVGRDQELALLLDRWAQAKAGEGQSVLLVGEAGIGKSRVTRALLDSLSVEPHTCIRYQCSPYHTDSALWPVVQQLGRAAALEPGDSTDEALDKLEALIGAATDGTRAAAAVIAPLLGLEGEQRYGRLGLTPQAQRARALDALIGHLTGLARERPVLVVLEDAHWVDATTLELIECCLDRITDTRALILLTSRPDNQPALAARPAVTQLTLKRLGRAGVEAIVTSLRGDRPLPRETIDAIVARTDGVPLFVEELTKAILETGETGVPATLHDALVGRLDHLPEAKEVAQVGACIGRDFDYRLLSAVAGKTEDELIGALDKLARAELIFRRGASLQATYSFKHAMVRDVAYQSLLKSRRQQLHAQIAEAMRRHFPESVATAPELLAEHYAEAGAADEAIEFGLMAGQLAARRAANAEAARHLQKTLELVRAQSEGRVRDEKELEVLTHLGNALLLVKGWGAPEIEAVYERARALAGKLEKSVGMVPALVGSWLFYISSGRLDDAEEATTRIFEVADATQDRDLLLQAHHAAWPIPAVRGAFAESRPHIEHGLALYDFDQHRHHALTYMGHDPGVCAHVIGTNVSYGLGRLAEAGEHARNAVTLAGRVQHAPTLAFALSFLGIANAARSDVAGTGSVAEELLRLSEEQRLPQMRATAMILGGWAMAADAPKAGVEQIDIGLSSWRRIGMRNFLQTFGVLAAEASLAAGDHQEGLRQISEALMIGEETGEGWWRSRALAVQGTTLLHLGDTDAAKDRLEAALRCARQQGAKSWELRAATSLARLRAERGDRREAHDLLAPIYGWFTEGVATPDLIKAKALLDQLS